jgi:hypothetical protein
MKEFKKLLDAYKRECLIKIKDNYWYASDIEKIMIGDDSYTSSCVSDGYEYFLIHADSSGVFYFKMGILTRLRSGSEFTIMLKPIKYTPD